MDKIIANWIQDNSDIWFTPGGDAVWVCSNCGGGRHVFGVETFDDQPTICPDCGALMLNAMKRCQIGEE